MDATAQLRSRTAALEADNAALAAAAEEAAALAEHYAAAHSEAEAAAERAARRANRMDARADADAAALARFTRLTRASARVESALRAQLALARAHLAPACCCAPATHTAPCAALAPAINALLARAAPASAQRLADAAAAIVAADALRAHLAMPVGAEAANHAAEAAGAVRAAAVRGAEVGDALPALRALARQARCFAAAMGEAKADEPAVALHVALLRAAATELRTRAPFAFPMPHDAPAPRALHEELAMLVEQAAEKKSAPEVTNEGELEVARERSRARELESALKERAKELDDAVVRASVFEQRIAVARQAEQDAAALRIALAARDRELADVRAALAAAAAQRADAARAARASPVRQKAPSPTRRETPAPVHALLRALDDHAARQRKLRMETARLLLADLIPCDDDGRQDVARDRVLATRDVARDVLAICRRTAAMARVVRLDGNSLTPIDPGATLSRAAVERAAGVAGSLLEAMRDKNISVAMPVAAVDDIVKLARSLHTVA